MDASPAISDGPGIRAESLTCAFNERILFEDLSFSVAPGQILEIRGANGTGKTTLLRVLSGLKNPDQGQVLWNGVNIDDDESEFRQALTCVTHRNGIKADLTVRENLVMDTLLADAAAAQDIAAILARVSLAAFTDAPTRQLSSGQQRRLALARLLVSAARVWLLDEPYASLDDSGKELVGEILAEHAADGGLAVVATHDAIRGNAATRITVMLS